MQIKKRYIYSLIIVITTISLGYIFRNVDFKPYSNASANMGESVKSKVFIGEYKIDSLKLFDRTRKLVFDNVWLEKVWGMDIDSSNNVYVKVDKKLTQIVFRMNEDSDFKNRDCFKTWNIVNNDLVTEKDNDRIRFVLYNQLHKNTKWKIYITKDPLQSDTVKVAEFILIRK